MKNTLSKTDALPFEVAPLEPFGMEIKGLDLSAPLADEVFTAIKQVFAESSIVLFRGQNLSVPAQEAFTALFGPPPEDLEPVWAPDLDRNAEPGKPTTWGRNKHQGLYPLLNKGETIYFVNGPGLADKELDRYSLWDQKDSDKGGGRGHASWHTGNTETVDTEYVTMLYAELAATEGGYTYWSDNTGAYEALSDSLKQKMDSYRVIHYFTFGDGSPPVSQPLVKTHPITGKKSFYMNLFTAERIEGLGREESSDVLHMVLDQICQPQFIYQQRWKDGDLLLWNNNTTMHKRGALVSGVKRIMRRTQANAPEFQSTKPWDKTRLVQNHDGGDWFPLRTESK